MLLILCAAIILLFVVRNVIRQAENESLKGSIVGSLGERGRQLVATCLPAEDGGDSLVTANPKQATKVRRDCNRCLLNAVSVYIYGGSHVFSVCEFSL